MAQLYLISPPQFELDAFATQLEQALSTAHVPVFQLRMKSEDYVTPVVKEEIKAATEVLMPLCHKYNTQFILNDSPALAVELGADGVHIGEDDGSVAEARTIMGEEKVLGVSCYDSRHRAMKAAEQDADYVAFGAFFPTQSKPQEKLRKPDPGLLTWWSSYTEIPCVAIGGVNADNAKILHDAGADFIAVMSYVWNHPQGVKEAVTALSTSG